MTKRGLQGLAAGIFLTSAILTYLYFFQTQEVESHEDETEIPELKLSSEEMMDILTDKGFVVLEEDEYQSLLKAKEEAEANEEEPMIEEPVHHGVLVVKSGMNSTQVAELLAELQVIDDTNAFIDYLRNENLTTKIEVGEFELNSSMSYEEIAKIITKRG